MDDTPVGPGRGFHQLTAKEEIHHIAILNDIFLAFTAHLARVFGALLALEGDVVIKRNGLRADVAFFKVGVNHTRRLRASVTNAYGPGTDFFHTSGEVSLQAQQLEGGDDQPVQARLKTGCSQSRLQPHWQQTWPVWQ